MGCHAHSCTSSIKHGCPKVGFNEFISNRQINKFCILPSDFPALPYPSWILRLPGFRGISRQTHWLLQASCGSLGGKGEWHKPHLYGLVFLLLVPSPWAAWLFPGSCVGSSPELGRSVSGGDWACVYTILGQGEVTAVQAVVSKCWTRDCNISAL